MSKIFVQLFTTQYQIWHTLSIDTLRTDVALDVIDADDFETITGRPYTEPVSKESDSDAAETTK